MAMTVKRSLVIFVKLIASVYIVLVPKETAIHALSSSSLSSSSFVSVVLPRPPFPNGVGGGKIVSLPGPDSWTLPPRPVEAWLPRSYLESTTSLHPTIYVHDGQNAVEDARSWTGRSWRLAGAIERLHERGLLGAAVEPILVLLGSAEGDMAPGVRRRHMEYGDALTNPVAIDHAAFVAETLVPLVDRRFRTNTRHRYAMGSSMGGQAALHLLLRYPHTFVGAACMSPCFQPGTLAMAAGAVVMGGGGGKAHDTNASSSPSLSLHHRIYMDNGGDQDDVTVPWVDPMDHATSQHWWNPGYWWLDTQLQPSVDAMRAVLNFMDGREQDGSIVYHKFPGARHNERAWSHRIHEPILHLLGRHTTWDSNHTEHDHSLMSYHSSR